jgi:hypothetical protein
MRQLVLTFFLSCGPALYPLEPDFVSNCGIKLFYTDRGGEFLFFEEDAIATFHEYVPSFSKINLCDAWRGYRIEVQHIRAWEWAGREIGGLALCREKHILVDWDTWYNSSVMHELAHATDNCKTRGHQGWTDLGIYDAIANIQSTRF